MIRSIHRAALLVSLFTAPLAAQTPTPGAAPATITAGHRAAAVELLGAVDVRGMMEKMPETMVQGMLQSNPEMTPYADIMREFMTEQLDWKVLEPQMIDIYVQVFSESELRELTSFYRTPLGRMVLTRMPEIMTRSNAISQERLRTSMPQLMERIMARARELEQSPGQQKP